MNDSIGALHISTMNRDFFILPPYVVVTYNKETKYKWRSI